jgi:thiosulfate dehydrogenase
MHLFLAVFVAALIANPVDVVAQPANAARGKALLQHFRDSLPAFSGNTLRCTSCHLDDGARGSAMPWHGAAATYPRYRARLGAEESLAHRVNECVARSLAGRMLPEDSREMRDMLAYLDSLGRLPRPTRPDTVRLVGRVAAGRASYRTECARCHGPAGQGIAALNAPAVWGRTSYSIGAGMARQFTLATFLRHNMPYDKPGTLTPQMAADIAAFVLSQPRQDHPGKQRDWPNGDAPADVAYRTDGAVAKGRTIPAARPLLARRVAPHATQDHR